MKKIIFGACMFFVSNLSYAYGIANSTVDLVRIDRNGKGMIKFDSSIGHEPASCTSATYVSYMSFDANTDGGKAIYSLALAAAASGKKVIAYGTGTCGDYSNVVESISYIHFYR
ncbi:hypothetical protein [Marinagarivorans algicola]|uniref:hypothetical protein n=1 Tax=Marinagarivorans algicola TaxID=1513270 RepID=UPI003734D661